MLITAAALNTAPTAIRFWLSQWTILVLVVPIIRDLLYSHFTKERDRHLLSTANLFKIWSLTGRFFIVKLFYYLLENSLSLSLSLYIKSFHSKKQESFQEIFFFKLHFKLQFSDGITEKIILVYMCIFKKKSPSFYVVIYGGNTNWMAQEKQSKKPCKIHSKTSSNNDN